MDATGRMLLHSLLGNGAHSSYLLIDPIYKSYNSSSLDCVTNTFSTRNVLPSLMAAIEPLYPSAISFRFFASGCPLSLPEESRPRFVLGAVCRPKIFQLQILPRPRGAVPVAKSCLLSTTAVLIVSDLVLRPSACFRELRCASMGRSRSSDPCVCCDTLPLVSLSV